MIITVDSNVLLSIFTKDSLYKKAVTLISKYSVDEFVVNEFIYLELGVHFQDLKLLDESLETLEVRFVRQSITNYLRSLINFRRGRINGYSQSTPYTGIQSGRV